MNIGKHISLILILGLSLVASACGPVKNTSSTPTNTFTPTSALTATPTFTLTQTLTSTLTPTDTLTLTPTPSKLIMLAPTHTLIPEPTLPGIMIPTLSVCIPVGQPSCTTQSTTLPLLGTCTVTVCTDSCGNLTSSSTGSCK